MISKLKYKNKNYFQTEKLSKSNHRFDIHLLLDYTENVKVSQEMSEYMKSRQFNNERGI